MIRLKTCRLLWMALPLLVCSVWANVHAQANLNPAVAGGFSIRTQEIVPDLERNGLHGMGIVYQVVAPDARPERLLQIWGLSCRLEDENGYPLTATQGTSSYAKAGYCVDSLLLTGKSWEKATKADTLFYPYFALGTEVGKQRLVARLALFDLVNNAKVASVSTPLAMINKPPMRMVRLQMERMQAKPVNADGETWDYKFFNPKDVFPDLQWTLRRGSEWVFEGEKQKNDTFYLGNVEDRSPWIFISQGDKLQLQVIDFDILGASDQIGTQEIDVEERRYAAGVAFDFRFGQVHSAKVIIDAVLPPKVVISSLELVEEDSNQGVSGMRLRLNYDQEIRSRDCEFHLGLAYVTPNGVYPVQTMRILGPGAVPNGDGTVLLTATRSPLELFVPNYALAAFPAATKQRMRLVLLTKINGQMMVVGNQDRQIANERADIQDMTFGQWKFGLEDLEGEGGIRMSLDYSLPAGYFQGLPEYSEITLVPSMKAPWGDVYHMNFVFMGTEKANWLNGKLILNEKNRQGTLDIFMPYRNCFPAAGKGKFAVSYRCFLYLDGEFIDLGKKGMDAAIELPSLKVLHFSVREAAVSRRKWLLSDPNLYWVLKVGNTEVFRSPTKTSTRDAKWQDEIEKRMVTAPTDKLTVEVIHKGVAGEPDKVVESWQVLASEMPDKPKGNTRLDPKALRKLVIHSWWDE